MLHAPAVEHRHGFFCLHDIIVGIRHDTNEHSFHHGSIVREGDNYLPGDWMSSGRLCCELVNEGVRSLKDNFGNIYQCE
jgi:hypothetical protein